MLLYIYLQISLQVQRLYWLQPVAKQAALQVQVLGHLAMDKEATPYFQMNKVLANPVGNFLMQLGLELGSVYPR